MSPLVAPVLAQLLSLGLSDRTEGRYVSYSDTRAELATNPRAALRFTDRHYEASLGYGPRLTVTPLEREPRELLIFHEADVSVGYRLRVTALTLSSNIGWGKVNFLLAAVQGQPAATDTGNNGNGSGNTGGNTAPGTGNDAGPGSAPEPTTPTQPTTPMQPGPGAGDPRIASQDVQVISYYTSITTLSLQHQASKHLDLGALATYSLANGLDEESRRYFGSLNGVSGGVNASYKFGLSKRETFLSTGSFLETWSSNGNLVGTLQLTQTWNHAFGPHTTGSLGAGISITRFSQSDGLRGFSIFPNFMSSLSHQVRVGRGTLGLSLYAYSTPVLDPLRALVDPRLGAGTSINYVRDRLFASLSGGAAFSIAPTQQEQGAIDAAQGEALIGYRLADELIVDAGGRYARLGYQGVEVLGNTWAGFVGLTLVLDAPLLGTPH